MVMTKKSIDTFRPHFFADWRLWTRKPVCNLQDEAVLLRAADEYWLADCMGLPSEPHALADVLGVSVEATRSMLRSTLAHVIEGDRLHFPKIAANHSKARSLSDKQSARAKARWNNNHAGAPPRLSHLDPNPDPDLDPKPNPDRSTCEEAGSSDTAWMHEVPKTHE